MKKPMVLVLALLGVGCVSRSILEMSMEQRLVAQVHERGLPLDQVTVPFSLTPEMRKWAHEHVPAVGGADLKLDMLLRALLSTDGGVRLVYESGFTGTTAEVFANPQHPYTKSLFAAAPGQGFGSRIGAGVAAG